MRNPDDLVEKRLLTLKLAEQLGSVSEACRQTGIDRTSFYEWKRRYALHGHEGLRSRSSRHASHPHTTQRSVEDRVKLLALEHPALGCDRLEKRLSSEGLSVSATTIRRLMREAGLATSRERWLALDLPFATAEPPFTTEQIAFLQTQNPCWRDYGRSPASPGEVLVSGPFKLATPNGRRVYLHCAIEPVSNLAFANLGEFRDDFHGSEGLRMLRETLIERYGLRPPRLYKTYAGNSWVARYLQYFRYPTNQKPLSVRHKIGAFERFCRTVQNEFQTEFGRRLEDNAEAFAKWLDFYNRQRPLHGYPNYGLPPLEALEAAVRKDAAERRKSIRPR